VPAVAVGQPLPAVDASCSYCSCYSCSSSAGVAVAAEQSAAAAAVPAAELVAGLAVGHFVADSEIEQSPAAEEFAGWAVEAARREVVEVAVVLAFAVWGEHSGAEEAVVVVVVAAAVAAVEAAVAEVALGLAVAAEAGGVESAVALDPDLRQRGSATDSSSGPGAAAVREAGHSEAHSGVKPGMRRAALPCAEPSTVAAFGALREPEDPEDAASVAAVAVGRVAVPEQLVQLASVASVGSGSCAGAGGWPFVLAGRRDLPASGRIAGGSCLDDRSCPCPYPCRSSAAAVAELVAAAVVAAVAEPVALPSSAVDEPCAAVVASSIGDCRPLREVVLASYWHRLVAER
jgi:hypothetical protein